MIKFTETKVPASGSNRVALVKDFLDQHYDIKINIFDHSKVTIVAKTKEYEEEISIEDISLHMLEDGISGSDSILKKIITSPNQTKPYNPIKEYFDSLAGTFAGASHIDKLCSYLKPRDFGDKPEGYYQKRLVYTLRKWIVATVACAMGIKENDAMFVIVNNEEGLGKSYLLEYLVPDPLRGYFTKSVKDMNYPDMFTSNLLINFDEMVGITKSTEEEFKNVLSSKLINVSKRFTTTKQRYASASGTSNRDAEHGGFLTPGMGTRRFAINHIETIDWEYNQHIEVDQIWAEAMMLLTQNFEYTWNPEDFRELGEYNARFIVQTSSFKLIKEFYRIPEPGEEEVAVFKMPVEILRDLRAARKVNTSMTTVSDVNIGIALKQLGYSRFIKKINGQPRYGYNIIQLF
ncbi:MAG: VapE domain-containing protein [Bacteroidales bacterium]